MHNKFKKLVEQNIICLTNCLHTILPQILCFALGLSFFSIAIMENVNKVVNQTNQFRANSPNICSEVLVQLWELRQECCQLHIALQEV